jgi:carbon storage regulator
MAGPQKGFISTYRGSSAGNDGPHFDSHIGGTPMLVLTRRLDEAIVINGDIRVTVVSIRGDTVRLGITAPKDVRVDRQEIHERRKGSADKEIELYERYELRCASGANGNAK